MASRILRAVVVMVVLAAQAGAGYAVWELEQVISAERGAADSFDRQARLISLRLADLRAAFQAYVADGQNGVVWQKAAADLLQIAASQSSSLRESARSPEAQSAIEDAIELVGALGKADVRARDYLASAQRLSASDVVFAEAGPLAERASSTIDLARGQEGIARAGSFEKHRVTQVSWLAGAVAVTLVGLLSLFPVPRAAGREVVSATERDVETERARAGIFQVWSTARPSATQGEAKETDWPVETVPEPALHILNLSAAADLCISLARVKEPSEFTGLLERAADILDAIGIIVWMPDGPGDMLRPAVAHGYTPVALARMGNIATSADNATALAFRSRATEVVSAEGEAGGAIVAPLVTADGCSGVMAAELRRGVTPTDSTRAVATIIAAQMATLISPSPSHGETV